MIGFEVTPNGAALVGDALELGPGRVRKIHAPRTASSIPVRSGGTNPQKAASFRRASAESRLVRLETGTYRIGASETRSALRQLADGRAAVVDTVDAQLKMT